MLTSSHPMVLTWLGVAESWLDGWRRGVWERETERQRARLVELTWLLRFSTSKGWGERKQVSTEDHQAEGFPELPVVHIVILNGYSHLLG